MTLEQQRSESAWKVANERKNRHPKDFTTYRNATKSAPMMMMNAGIMSTLAYLHSRTGSNRVGCSQLAHDLMQWIGTRQLLGNFQAPQDQDRLFKEVMARLLRVQSLDYQTISTEVLAYLRWLRQFTDALKDKDEKPGEPQSV